MPRYLFITSYTYCPDMEDNKIVDVSSIICSEGEADLLRDKIAQHYADAADGNDSYFTLAVMEMPQVEFTTKAALIAKLEKLADDEYDGEWSEEGGDYDEEEDDPNEEE